jgi:hypothetical protein
VGTAGLVGITGLTAQISSLSVQVNKTSDTTTAPSKVLDFNDGTEANPLSFEVSTGPSSDAVTIDIDGNEGVLLAVMTNLTLDVFGFVQLDGSLAFKQATASFVLTDQHGTTDTTTLAT